MELENKVVLITGAASGIGLETVKEFLREGVKGVAMCDIDENKGIYEADKLKEEFGKHKVMFIKTNIRDEEEFEAAFKKAIDNFDHLDIVMNNAAILNDVDYELSISTNLIGTTRGTFLGLKYLGKNQNGKGGIIVNISSIAALDKLHRYTSPIYTATKAGIVKISQGLGHSFHMKKTGVKIMAVCPGGTFTPLHMNNTFLEGCLKECAWGYFYAGKLFQTVGAVARSIVYVVRNGESQSTWLVDDSNLYRIEDVDVLQEHKILEVDNI